MHLPVLLALSIVARVTQATAVVVEYFPAAPDLHLTRTRNTNKGGEKVQIATR